MANILHMIIEEQKITQLTRSIKALNGFEKEPQSRCTQNARFRKGTSKDNEKMPVDNKQYMSCINGLQTEHDRKPAKCRKYEEPENRLL